jgi:mannan endo-1,4-beta-mannosidase
MYDLHNNN